MKILLISSSPRKEKSQTFLLAKEVLKGCGGKNAECKIVHLRDLKIDFCRHCESCHRKILLCPVKDDAHVVIQKMLEADGIILASPNYINQVTGSMKTLFDRASHFIHCRRLLDKYIAAVVTSGGGQDLEVLEYIKYYAHTCAAQYSGGVSSCAYKVSDKLEEARRLGKRLAANIEEKKVFTEQMKIIEAGKEHFKKIIQLRKNDWKEEYNYWRQKGWL
ncbi:MAG: flavodoxin family protein [Candidatus Omnitrophota bacterium]|nr:flavodoxin family protein [Candidatus Omnitrophota bacterium]